MLIGVTGSIGAGKSAFLRAVKELCESSGLKIITLDADKIVHELYSDGCLNPLLREKFPEAFLYGQLDKKTLAKIVFANPQKLKLLESIVHPLVREEVERRCSAYKGSEERHAFVEVQLLIEVGWQDLFDRVILVDAPREIRLKRALRRGLSPEDFHRRDSRQLRTEEKLMRCPNCIVVINDIDDPFILKEKASEVLREIGIIKVN